MCAKSWKREREGGERAIKGMYWRGNFGNSITSPLSSTTYVDEPNTRTHNHTHKQTRTEKIVYVYNVSIHGEIRWSVKRLVHRELIRVQRLR